MSTSVLTLDSEQIHILLSNPGLFTDNEIKLAAKRKVMLDKKKDYDLFVQLKRNSDLNSMQRAQNRAMCAYDQGFNQSLNDPYGLSRLVGGWL